MEMGEGSEKKKYKWKPLVKVRGEGGGAPRVHRPRKCRGAS